MVVNYYMHNLSQSMLKGAWAFAQSLENLDTSSATDMGVSADSLSIQSISSRLGRTTIITVLGSQVARRCTGTCQCIHGTYWQPE